MNRAIMIRAVRARFSLTSREKACRQIETHAEKYLQLGQHLDEVSGRRQVTVPPMLGVDEDMRQWSFFMILEHNVIVNRTISEMVTCLASGTEPTGMGVKDPKKDVMPTQDPGPEQVDLFQTSVEDHFASIVGLGKLRGTEKRKHPVFGMFDAHQWHCMFALHLEVHLKQAAHVAKVAAG